MNTIKKTLAALMAISIIAAFGVMAFEKHFSMLWRILVPIIAILFTFLYFYVDRKLFTKEYVKNHKDDIYLDEKELEDRAERIYSDSITGFSSNKRRY